MTEESYPHRRAEQNNRPLVVTADDSDIIKYGLNVMPSAKMIEMENIYSRLQRK